MTIFTIERDVYLSGGSRMNKKEEDTNFIEDPLEEKLKEILEREERRISGKAAGAKIVCHGYCNDCNSRIPCEELRAKLPDKAAGV